MGEELVNEGSSTQKKGEEEMTNLTQINER